MSTDNPFLIGDEQGVSPQINGLFGMFRYVRKTTLETVAGLSVQDLDHLQDPDSNSIGGLLCHMAAVEAWYQANTFDRREWTPAETARWQVALDLGPGARSQIRERPLEFYLAQLTEVRSHTECELRACNDDWLAESGPFFDLTVNNYWKWFHVCEDEVSHRGQIRWLRKRLPGRGLSFDA